MFRKIMVVTFVSILFTSCSLFNSGSGRSSSFWSSGDQAATTNGNNSSNNNNSTNIVLCTPKDLSTYASDARKSELYQTITSNFLAASSSCTYNYGLKVSPTNTIPQTFAVKDLNAVISNCTGTSQNCAVSIYADKAASAALRPVFVISPVTNTTCDPKYQAYIRSIVMLGKEAINPPASMVSPNITQPNTICPTILAHNPLRKDYLCTAGSAASQILKYSTFSVAGFDVIPSPAADLVQINFNSNLPQNLVCIDSLIKSSLWGTTLPRVAARKTDISVFKVDLVMKQ